MFDKIFNKPKPAKPKPKPVPVVNLTGINVEEYYCLFHGCRLIPHSGLFKMKVHYDYTNGKPYVAYDRSLTCPKDRFAIHGSYQCTHLVRETLNIWIENPEDFPPCQ